MFGLGKSAWEPDVRYLKQLKVRSAETEYHAENVVVARIEKPDNFLRLTPFDLGPESVHLRERTDDERGQRDAAILDLHGAGRSYREIAAQLGCSKTTVQKVVHRDAAVPAAPPPEDAGTGTDFEEQLGLAVPPYPGGAGWTPSGDGQTGPPPDPPRPGDRVRTPDGVGTVLQVFAERVTVRPDGHDRTAHCDPVDVEPLAPEKKDCLDDEART